MRPQIRHVKVIALRDWGGATRSLIDLSFILVTIWYIYSVLDETQQSIWVFVLWLSKNS